MSIKSVREHLGKWQRENDIIEFEESSATVELAAGVLGVGPERIAKTISLRGSGNAILIVAAGDVKIDNKKFKTEFGIKARMLTPEEVQEFTGHETGGVCPFGLKDMTKVFLDESLKRFSSVYPACGSRNSAIELSVQELEKYSSHFEKWVDVCSKS